ncbi:hypothetical protein SAMN04490196_5440 [Pseudomonas moraviensis]|nr:hypothetical protein SAMN04490196_5440 [Pseudomonas moraviensis]
MRIEKRVEFSICTKSPLDTLALFNIGELKKNRIIISNDSSHLASTIRVDYKPARAHYWIVYNSIDREFHLTNWFTMRREFINGRRSDFHGVSPSSFRGYTP